MGENKRHIVIFDGSLRPSTFVYRLAVALSSHHKVWIAGFSGKSRNDGASIGYLDLGSADAPLALFWKGLGWAASSFFTSGNPKSIFRLFGFLLNKNFKGLQQQNLDIALKKVGPDIVHVQWPSLLPWCEHYLENSTYNIILSQRGYQTNVRPWIDEENLAYQRKWYPKIAGFHSVSGAISKVGDRIYSSEGKKDAVVYSGFDLSSFEPSKHAPENKVIQIISIGRPHWKKGYTDALRAMGMLKQDGVDFHYTIVGAKDEEELQFIIHDLGLESNVTLMDKVSQTEVYSLVHASNVLLLPSLEEGLPNVVVEAMLLRTPVVATNCGGVAELVDANTGFLVSLGEPTSIHKGLRTFMNISKEVLCQKIDRAKEKASAQHSDQQMVRGMLALYEDVLMDSIEVV